jgi:glycosyltransferase involved in cell wall biosynthesis
MKIAIIGCDIIDKFLFVGYYPRLFIALAKRGHDVTWVGARASRSSYMPEAPGFRLETLPQERTVPLLSLLSRQLFAAWKALKFASHYDAIIFHDVRVVPFAFPILVIRRFASRRPALFLRVTTNPQETGGYLKTMMTFFIDALSVKIAAVFFDRMFFISPMMAQMYAERFCIRRDKIGIWPPAVDSAFFLKRSASRVTRLRGKLGKSDELLVLYHGYLSKARNLLETASAFKILKGMSIPKAKLLLLGDGPLKQELCEYVRVNHLAGSVQLLEPVEYAEVPDYIAACDVGIVPLPDHIWFRYQCPIKLLEYLAISKAVIVSNIPANRWVVDNFPVGSYLEGTSPLEIAQGIETFMRVRKSLRPKIGRQIAKCFSTERIAEFIEQQIFSANSKNVAHSNEYEVEHSFVTYSPHRMRIGKLRASASASRRRGNFNPLTKRSRQL